MSATRLKIGPNLSLPVDAVTQTFLIVGKRGSGKSNTAARFVEQLHHARLPFVVLDPVDTWWGLKAGRDGGEGLDVYVFGGRKADLPLEAGGGALIAEVLCEHRLSMVLSVKHLSGRERSAFMVAFAQTLFQKWGGGPLHVVLEEAHELAPQMSGSRGNDRNTDNEAAMLGAFKRLWKLGRSSGIGGTAVTQRPASLSKDITTQSEILIAHRTIGPQDVKAVGEWVKYHGEHLDILAELPSLPTGEAFIWAPEFPEGKPIGLQRTSVLLRETYDSASTPKVGEQRVEPKELAAVDLERLRTKMAATIEKAKADDPRELRKQIKALELQVAGKAVTAVAVHLGKQKPVLTDADRALLKELAEEFREFVDAIAIRADVTLQSIADRAKAEIDKTAATWNTETEKRRRLFLEHLEKTRFQKILDKLATVSTSIPHNTPTTNAVPRSPQTRRVDRALPPSTRSTPARLVSDGSMTPALRGPLLVLANNQEDGCGIGKLALLSGKRISGGFRNILAALRTNGWMDGSNTGVMRITAAGLTALGSYDVLPTGAELGEYWLSNGMLSPAAREILRVLLAHRAGYGIDALAERVDKQVSGGFRNLLAELRTAGVIVGRNTEVMRASEELFS